MALSELPSSVQLLVKLGEEAILRAPESFIRSQYSELKPTRRLLIARGARGVGKTVLLQQYAKRSFEPQRRAYLSLDDIVFRDIDLVDAVHLLLEQGRDQLVLDEVHRYPAWEAALKNCYDRYPNLRILVTGSSMLDLQRGSGDLSRRAYILDIPPLSFREYLLLEKELDIEAVPFDELLATHQQLHRRLELVHGDLQGHYENYLRYGSHPALTLSPEDASVYLRNIAVQTIDRDIVPVLGLKPQTVNKLHRLLVLIAESVPFKPTISKLAVQLDTSRELVVQMLEALDHGGLIERFWYGEGSDNRLAKPDKIYLAFPSLAYAFSAYPNRGTLREMFFFNQLSPMHILRLSKKGDFYVEGKTFEIGGPKKGFSQIANLATGYLALETFDQGHDHRIPLYLFGFLR